MMNLATGLIAVRLKSSRLSKKALLDLGGKPLLVRLYERVTQSKLMDRVIVCTSTHSEDDEIARIAREYGIDCFRGDEVDVMKRFLDCIALHPSQNIVRITGDNPLTDPEVIDELIRAQGREGADYSRMDGVPEGVTAEVISVPALRRIFGLAEDTSHSEYMTWYFTKNSVTKNHIAEAPAALARPRMRLTVDFLEDYELLKKIYSEFDFDRDPPPLSRIISFLDRHPEWSSLNQITREGMSLNDVNVRVR